MAHVHRHVVKRRANHYDELFVRHPTKPRPQIDIQSVSRHCFPINPYWEFAHAPPRYCAIKSQFVYENLLYSPLPDSFPAGEAKSPYSIPFLHIPHTGGAGFCLNTRIAFGTRVPFLLVGIV
jgi:hypothetical protein